MDGDVDGRIMDDVAHAHIEGEISGEISSSEWQTAHNVCNLNISRVEVNDCP